MDYHFFLRSPATNMAQASATRRRTEDVPRMIYKKVRPIWADCVRAADPLVSALRGIETSARLREDGTRAVQIDRDLSPGIRQPLVIRVILN